LNQFAPSTWQSQRGWRVLADFVGPWSGLHVRRFLALWTASGSDWGTRPPCRCV